MKRPTLTKLLKKQTLAALLSDLETLSGPNVAYSLYDAQDERVVGPDALRRETQAAQPAVATQTLIVQGETLGSLVATRTTGAGGETMDAAALAAPLEAAAELLAHALTQALENRALAEETLERYREINLLYRMQQVISSQFDVDQIADLILKESVRVIQATSGVLLLLVPGQPTFEVRARYGAAPLETACAHSDTIAGWAVRTRRATIVNDVHSDPRCGPADVRARSLLCVPLTVGEQSSGALLLYDKAVQARLPAAENIFTASDQKLLTALASQAAVAIQIAREVEARESRFKAQIRELRIEIDEMRKRRQVASITTTEYFASLQQSAQQMRREFEEGL